MDFLDHVNLALMWFLMESSGTKEIMVCFLAKCSKFLFQGLVYVHSFSGVLVVNINWKGRNYVGTLLDSHIHEWAPPK